MKEYTVQTMAMVPATAEHKIKANSQEEAENIVQKSIDNQSWESPYWKKLHHPQWAEAEDFTTIEK